MLSTCVGVWQTPDGALQGKPYQVNWKESWNTLNASEIEWAQLKKELKAEFETLIKNLQKQTELSGVYLIGVMALIRMQPIIWEPSDSSLSG